MVTAALVTEDFGNKVSSVKGPAHTGFFSYQGLLTNPPS
jgi:hypothetical protein